MPYDSRIPDKALGAKVTQKLSRCGGGSNVRINATVRNGTVTLSGMLDFDYQRKPIVRAINGVEGVRMVIDQLQVKPQIHWAKEKDRGGHAVQF
jgi:osmotically-inducible protein OsmY